MVWRVRLTVRSKQLLAEIIDAPAGAQYAFYFHRNGTVL